MRGRPVLAAVVLLLAERPARPDHVRSTSGAPLVETRHTVAIDLEDGVAGYTVLRTLRHDGDEPAEIELALDLPRGGALTGLRLRSGSEWRDAKLIPRDDARARWAVLVAPGKGRPRTAAMLETLEAGGAGLRLGPLLPGKPATVEYTIQAPLHRAGGRVYLQVPASFDGGRAPAVRVDPGDARDVREAEDVPVFDTDDGGEEHGGRWISAVPTRAPPTGTVEVRFSTSVLSSGRSLVRLEIDAAAALGEAPRRARVVFVLDASHSEGALGVRAQLDVVRGYLAHVPDATFEIVVFRRDASRLFGRFVRATDLDSALDAAPPDALATENGSNLDRGIALAAEILARDAGKGPARIVAMTDARLASELGSDRLVDSLDGAPQGTVAHVVLREHGTGPLAERRVAHDTLDPVARASGGTTIEITGTDRDPAGFARIATGLVRPIRIDELAHVNDRNGERPIELSSTLDEGTSMFRLGVWDGAATDRITLEGEIWGKRWRKTVTADRGLAARIPVLVFGHPTAWELGDEETAALATLGGVVSRTTSLLVEERGAGSSTAGGDRALEDAGGVGFGVGRGAGSMSGRASRVDADPSERTASLRERIEHAAASCAGRREARVPSPTIGIETTRDEIVAVSVAGLGAHPELRACVEDAAWSVRLDDRFGADAETHRFAVAIGGQEESDEASETDPVRGDGGDRRTLRAR